MKFRQRDAGVVNFLVFMDLDLLCGTIISQTVIASSPPGQRGDLYPRSNARPGWTAPGVIQILVTIKDLPR